MNLLLQQQCPYCCISSSSCYYYMSPNSLSNHKRRFHAKDVREEKEKKRSLLLFCKECKKVFASRQSRYRHEKGKSCLKQRLLLCALCPPPQPPCPQPQPQPPCPQPQQQQLVSLGAEDMSVLSMEEKEAIMNSGFFSMNKLIEIMHLNDKYKAYQNVRISNLRDKYAMTYDDKTNMFVKRERADILDDLINYRKFNLETINNECNRGTPVHKNVTKWLAYYEAFEDIESQRKDMRYKELCEYLKLLFHRKNYKRLS